MAVLSRPAPAPRVRLLRAESAPMAARALFADGDPGPIAASLAHLPDLFAPALAFIGAALAGSWLPTRTKEIVILRMSALAGCRYCTAAHSVVALDNGLTVDQVRGLRGELPHELLFVEGSDRAVICWCDAVHAGSDSDLSAARAQLGRHYDDASVVELTVCATATLMLNRYATSLALPVSAETLTRLAAEGLPG